MLFKYIPMAVMTRSVVQIHPANTALLQDHNILALWQMQFIGELAYKTVRLAYCSHKAIVLLRCNLNIAVITVLTVYDNLPVSYRLVTGNLLQRNVTGNFTTLVMMRKRVLFRWLFSTPEVFSPPEADVYIAIDVLTDVKPYNYNYKSGVTRKWLHLRENCQWYVDKQPTLGC
jgi:hypothetical protein